MYPSTACSPWAAMNASTRSSRTRAFTYCRRWGQCCSTVRRERIQNQLCFGSLEKSAHLHCRLARYLKVCILTAPLWPNELPTTERKHRMCSVLAFDGRRCARCVGHMMLVLLCYALKPRRTIQSPTTDHLRHSPSFESCGKSVSLRCCSLRTDACLPLLCVLVQWSTFWWIWTTPGGRCETSKAPAKSHHKHTKNKTTRT